MSDTPRTDAAWKPDGGDGYPTVDVDFVRQLERELNAANRRISRLVQAGDCLLSHSKSTDYHEKIIEWYKAKKDKP